MRCTFSNILFWSRYWTMGKFQKPSSNKSNTPQSWYLLTDYLCTIVLHPCTSKSVEYSRFDVLTTRLIIMPVLWNVMLC